MKNKTMINGAHVVVYSRDAEADRAFLRDVLGFPHVDAGHDWLIFKLPPAEAAVHPGENDGAELYLMCDDLAATLDELTAKGVEIAQPISEAGWGSRAAIKLPSGAALALYEPRHPVAYDL